MDDVYNSIVHLFDQGLLHNTQHNTEHKDSLNIILVTHNINKIIIWWLSFKTFKNEYAIGKFTISGIFMWMPPEFHVHFFCLFAFWDRVSL